MSKIIDYFKNLTWDDILHIITSWYGILFITCFVILIIYFICFLSINPKKSKKRMMAKTLNVVRHYSIHYKENYVYTFDKFRLKNGRRKSFEWFYDTFSLKDRKRVEVWLKELQKENHSVPHHLELHIKIKNVNTTIFTVISVSSINYDKGIIHLESRVFPNIKKTSNIRKRDRVITHYKELPDIISQNKTAPKNIFLIRLYSINELDDLSRINHLVITLIISRLLKYCSKTRFISLLNQNEILILDFKITTKNEAYALSHTLSAEISKILFLSSIYEDYEYKIGIVQKKECSATLNEEIKLAREMSILAQNDESNAVEIIYDENTHQNNNNKDESILKDIRNYMDKRLFNCSYIPILNTYDSAIFGYMCELVAPNALINNVEDMLEYASKTNFLTELIRILYIETNKVFNLNTNLNRFVYTTMLLKPSYYLSFIDVYNHTEKPNHTKTIFIIEDDDLYEDQQKALQIIKELKKVGMCLGLKITSTNLDLTPEIMRSFDFFFLYEESFKKAYEAQNQILYGDMISRLSFYSAQIISVNISSWPLIDFACKHSIKHLSSPLFAEGTKILPQIDSKRINKFSSICKRYEIKR